jgi:hypothetical protein
MRRTLTLAGVLAAILALCGLLVMPSGVGAQITPATQRKQASPDTHVPFDVPTRDNFSTLTYNHFGNPAAGQAVLDTWIRQTYSDLGLPLAVTGQARALTLYQVKRIAVRVSLITDGGDTATSALANTNGARQLTISSPSITANTGGQPALQFCEAWTRVDYAIRWADDTLTSGKSFLSASDLWNDNGYFDPCPA